MGLTNAIVNAWVAQTSEFKTSCHRIDAGDGLVRAKSFDLRAGEVENTNPCRRPTGHSVAVEDIDEDIDWSSTNKIICFHETFDVDAITSTACYDFDERFFFEAGRCYPQSGAPLIETGGSMDGSLYEGGSPKECYDWCVVNYNENDNWDAGFITHYDIKTFMGLDLRVASRSWDGSYGPECMCKSPGWTD